MAIKVALEHRTTYYFDRLVEVHPHVVRLRPAAHSRTKIDAYSLKVEPADHFINWQQDAFGNYLARLVFPERTDKLEITVGLIADMAVINPFDFFIEEWAEHIGFEYPTDLRAELAPYLAQVDEDGEGSGPGALAQRWVKEFAGDRTETGWANFPDATRTIDFLVKLNDKLRTDITYSLRMEPGVQSPDHTLRTAVGSCRDSSWLLVSVLRQLGLAARFVSGYLIQLTSDVPALDGGPSGPAADFTDLHAWTEVFLPGAGWVGLDPTSGLFAGEGHIPLSATPTPASAAPITGATGKCKSTLDYENVVRRIHEDPRVTLPYTEQQWDKVTALGARLDERMAEADIRLTMGGEPTFVSIDNLTDPEWTTAADGPHKRELASDLAARLKKIYAPTGLVQRSQGKWYPGEPLPRWQIGLLWRTDGESIWSDPELLADPWNPDADYGSPDHETAKALIAHIADELALPDTQVRPFFEDPLARLAATVRQPDGPPVEESDDLEPGADSTATRAALLARLEATVNEPNGYLLPLHRTPDETGWASSDWRLRRGRIVLLEGDSPAGLRLPLGAISWQQPPSAIPADPIEPKHQFVWAPRDEAAVVTPPEQAEVTALVAEVRDGLLYVFLPPIENAADFLDIVGRVEDAAAAVGQPVVIEGYGPPHDERLESLTITPDPGVIEVNVQPTETFAEQADLLTTLYEQARLSRLSTESFDVDGSHLGTGGGNHITLGGRTPAQSPMLRRPDLLVSMLTYWQRHPALSYLFSGRFIGTTSQAPRVDEGRESSLYELEVAFAEILRQCPRGEEGRPWVVDRALRHLLTDITGNTHRAEFCIDKLYSPDSARGRLGLLELRGFEMPPHFQMAMVQSLLVRGLVTRFWEEPLKAPLIRHGANLHGRYLLPHFIINDIARVAEDLREYDIEFDTAWLDPFTEFRFPRVGTAVFDDVEIELRGAIEPWNTLGEESTGTGTARYVDSSVERLQVRLVGADRGRYVLTCNGYPVPMMATDNPDIQVAGVRFRAWQPPSALHPTITVDGPLTFDLVEATSGLSRGGCTYHISHPGGLAHENPPVNAVEAESRRNRRFEAAGHTPGVVDLADLRERAARQGADIGAPGLLDLRRVRTVLSR
ncbi:transglutaminase family protein [Aldersonia sp. NBC_00410]|uniref:transglutaminase family protein n=1 Tax=Aldersonia sp. NBC_00410 TaxID=2975954 RepID=UPI002256FAAE|nr:transglutaminase family protein [Aldersonia sp. NBC_00410]MCX5043084.1 transglutaminase family protein [Aldersonia sp. NBC_00410]